MLVSYNWLKEYVDIDIPHEELAHLLTMSGLEVEGIETLGRSLEEIIVARIISVGPHPQADRLSLCSVDTGNGINDVVCGAPNVEAGMNTSMALPGVRLPNGNRVKEAKIRGQRSLGILLAEDELSLTDDHTGIMVLPNDIAPGTKLIEAMPLEDYVFEIGITPNRPDCTSIIGVAREIAALTGKKLRLPEITLEEGGFSINDNADVTIEDAEGCPRYAAGMIKGIKIMPSPFWMRYRLHACGIRSINNIVDVTNYVLLEMGQPLHSFDYDLLEEKRIVVKRAKEGDKFTTLDDQERTLSKETLMICDGKGPVAIAGIMGGQNSEINDNSENVLIESAFFDPIIIRRGSKRLGLSSEASYRFERGIDICGVTEALGRSVMLMHQLAGGEIATNIIDEYPAPYKPRTIELRVDRTNRTLGTDIPQKRMADHLVSIEMKVESKGDNLLIVEPPPFRVDIEREIDLVEEVARIEGYDNVPVAFPAIAPSVEPERPIIDFSHRIRAAMKSIGYSEIISFSFISPEFVDIFNAAEDSPLRSFVKVMNPLTVDQSVMRTSLLPGLIATVKNNIAHGENNLMLYEWGKTYIRKNGQDDLPEEKTCLSAIMCGFSQPNKWHSEERKIDFFDMKGSVESLMIDLGIRDLSFQRGEQSSGYHNEIYSDIWFKDERIGIVGQIDPNVLEAYEIKAGDTFGFEIDVEKLLELAPRTIRFEPYAKFPAVFRDISIIVNKDLESIKIIDIIKETGRDLIESVAIFDQYQGERIDPDKKALSFRISYRSKEKTLEGKRVNKLHDKIINQISKKTGGKLRES